MNTPKIYKQLGNGAYLARMVGNAVPQLTNGSLLTHDGSDYTVGTLRAFELESKIYAVANVKRERNGGHAAPAFAVRDAAKSLDQLVAESMERNSENRPHWINQNAGVICAGQHPNCGRVFLEVSPGDRVDVDGTPYIIRATHNRNLELELVTELVEAY